MSKNEEDKIAKPKEDTTNNEDNKTKKKADSNVIPKTESTGSCPVSMTFMLLDFFLFVLMEFMFMIKKHFKITPNNSQP